MIKYYFPEPDTHDKPEHDQKKEIDEMVVDYGGIRKPKGIGSRHIQIAILFIGFLIAFALRVNLSVAIVAMLDNSSNPAFIKYDWNESIRGLVLSSLFWGNAISAPPAGLLAQRFGPRVLLITASAMCCILTVTLPLTATLGWQYVFVSRMILGLFQGFQFPCVHALLAKWVHPSEKGILSSITYAAPPVGIVITLSCSGIVATSRLGWPGIFYISGGLSGIWCILWCFYGSNSPEEHRTISEEEKAFIQSMPGNTQKRTFATPWKHIFKSPSFLAILCANCFEAWGFYTLLSIIPSYMSGVFNFDIESNALLSALPYLVSIVLIVLFSMLSDFLINHHYISVGTGRKIFTTIGMGMPGICMIGLGFVTKDNVYMGVILLTIILGLNGAVNVGYLVNHIDLSPNYASTLVGLTHGIANILCLVGPIFVGYVVTDVANPDLWKIFFYLTAGFFLFGNIIYVIFAKGKIQFWNDVEVK